MSSDDKNLILEILNGRKPVPLSPAQLDPYFPVAVAHGLAGLVVEALGNDRERFEKWSAFASELEVSARFQIQAATEIAEAFKSRGIPVFFVKGLSLALWVYKPGVRPFHDVDALIAPADLLRADAALKELGFGIEDSSRGHPIEISYVREKLPGFRVCIDLHWDFTADDALQSAIRIPMSELFERARVVEKIPVPSIEDALLLAATNLARKSAEPLMLLVDFQRLAAQNPDWKTLLERARQWHLKTSLWLGLEMSQRLFNAAVPHELLRELAPPPSRARKIQAMLVGEKLWLSDKQQMWRYRLLFKWLCLDSFSDKATVIFSLPRGVLRKLGVTRGPADSLR